MWDVPAEGADKNRSSTELSALICSSVTLVSLLPFYVSTIYSLNLEPSPGYSLIAEWKRGCDTSELLGGGSDMSLRHSLAVSHYFINRQ